MIYIEWKRINGVYLAVLIGFAVVLSDHYWPWGFRAWFETCCL